MRGKGWFCNSVQPEDRPGVSGSWEGSVNNRDVNNRDVPTYVPTAASVAQIVADLLSTT